MKKILIILMVFLLMITTAIAENVTVYKPGSEQTVGEINTCYDELEVYVGFRDSNTTDRYQLPGCSIINDDHWKCECGDDNKYELVIDTDNNINDYFDFDIIYYIGERANLSEVNDSMLSAMQIENEKLKRSKTFDNIYFSDDKEIKELAKETTTPPFKITTNGIIMILVFLFLAILVALLIWKYFTREEKPNTRDDYFGYEKRKQNKEQKTKKESKISKAFKVKRSFKISKEKKSYEDEVNDILNQL